MRKSLAAALGLLSLAAAHAQVPQPPAEPQPAVATRPTLEASPARPNAGQDVLISWQFPANSKTCSLKVEWQKAANAPWQQVAAQTVPDSGQYTLTGAQPARYRVKVNCLYVGSQLSRSLEIPVVVRAVPAPKGAPQL